jgi:hypothetical protein
MTPSQKQEKNFLQGLKPLDSKLFTPGLKPRPPKEPQTEVFATADLFRKL